MNSFLRTSMSVFTPKSKCIGKSFGNNLNQPTDNKFNALSSQIRKKLVSLEKIKPKKIIYSDAAYPGFEKPHINVEIIRPIKVEKLSRIDSESDRSIIEETKPKNKSPQKIFAKGLKKILMYNCQAKKVTRENLKELLLDPKKSLKQFKKDKFEVIQQNEVFKMLLEDDDLFEGLDKPKSNPPKKFKKISFAKSKNLQTIEFKGSMSKSRPLQK